jgi:hypothetical protein
MVRPINSGIKTLSKRRLPNQARFPWQAYDSLRTPFLWVTLGRRDPKGTTGFLPIVPR